MPTLSLKKFAIVCFTKSRASPKPLYTPTLPAIEEIFINWWLTISRKLSGLSLSARGASAETLNQEEVERAVELLPGVAERHFALYPPLPAYDAKIRSESSPKQLRFGNPGPCATPASIGRCSRGSKPRIDRSSPIARSVVTLSNEPVAPASCSYARPCNSPVNQRALKPTATIT